MSVTTGSALAESKPVISAAEAIERVKKLIKDRYKEDSSNADRARAEAEKFAGGQVDRLDADVIEQGRKWAARLALIARKTAGGGYQMSKAAASIGGSVKKIFGIVGELEAMLAVVAEISLFENVDRKEYFGYSDITKLTVKTLVSAYEPGEVITGEDLAESILNAAAVGEKVVNDVKELLEQFEIEPVTVPEEEPKPAGKGGRKQS